MTEQEHELTPEVRTAAFFEQDPQSIAKHLVEGDGMVIAVTGTDTKVRIVEAEPYSKKDVGPRYGRMNDMRPGDLFPPPQRQILQSLIVAKDEDGVGACVRLKEVEYFDPTAQSFVPELTIGLETYKNREGDIARFLGLERNVGETLKFLDSSNTLYLAKGEVATRQIPSSDANHQLRSLLEGGSK